MFEVLLYKSFSADKTTVVGIDIIDDLKIFKLIDNNYELFQSIPIIFTQIMSLLDTLTISEDGKQITLNMRYNYSDHTFKLVYQEHNGKYKLTSSEEI